ncbi:MAG: EAL domain-containing protein [Acidimicrobiia bacterium]
MAVRGRVRDVGEHADRPRREPGAPGRLVRRKVTSRWTAWLVLPACVGLTVFAWSHSVEVGDALARDRTTNEAATLKRVLDQRLTAIDDLLSVGRASLSYRSDPTTINAVLNEIPALIRSYPGTRGFWFLTQQGDAVRVVYAAPNAVAAHQGIDVGGDRNLRHAFDATRDNDRTVLVRLGRLPRRHAEPLGNGPILLLVKAVHPMAATGSPAGAGAPRIWIAALVNANEFLASVGTSTNGFRSISLRDPSAPRVRPALASWPHPVVSGRATGAADATHSFGFARYGSTWEVRFGPDHPDTDPQLALARTMMLLLGLGVSVGVFLFFRSMRSSEIRALRLVDDATSSLARSEERFRALVHESLDMTVVVDSDGRLVYASHAAEVTLGHEVSVLVGTDVFSLVHPDDRATVEDEFSSLATGEPVRDPLQFRLRRADGHYLWVEAVGTNLAENPAIGGVILNLRDINERRRVDAALREAQTRFRTAFEEAPIGMALAGPDGELGRVNRSLRDMLGYDEDALVGRAVFDLTHPEDWPATSIEIQRLRRGDVPRFRLETRFLHSSGQVVWAAVSASMVRDDDGRALYMIGQIEDITERKAIGERLAHQAIHDPLTGLPNRVLFMDRLSATLAENEHPGVTRRVLVLFLDLDHFKFVNDSLGHAAGDRLLIAVAARLREILRPNDTVARFGGDEFTVICDDVPDEATAHELVERLAGIFDRPVLLPEGEVFVTASIGIALSRPGIDTPETLVRDADAAMYRAKDHGRNTWEMADEGAHDAAVDFLRTGNDLHRALERGEFRVHYQPIVTLETGRISGFEALLRWAHPERGLLAPVDFVGLAEETGLVVPIGRWVLEHACTQLARWQAFHDGGRHLTMSVNLSPRQLSEPMLSDEVARIVARSGVQPGSVWLEITESTLARDAESTISVLRALRAQGVHLAVDDFGTGYSSMSYLKRFPVEALKIDRSFVDGLGRDPEDTAIVTATVSLAHALGLIAVAEGVESPIQIAELRTLGCEAAQGYLFGSPLPVDALGDRPAFDRRTWEALRAAD